MKTTTHLKLVSLTFLLLIFHTAAFAQNNPVIEWENTIGGSMDEIPLGIIQTTDGGYLVTGKSQSNISGDKTENNMGSYYDYWILKLDAAGVIQWQNTIGGSDDDWSSSVLETPDGGFLVCGFSMSNATGDKTSNSYGIYDYWIVRVDAFGNILWQKVFGGDSAENLWTACKTNDGGFLLGGNSVSGISGNKTEANKGGQDIWIVRIDSLGNILWQKDFGGTLDDDLHSVIQTTDGGFLLGGTSASGVSIDKTEPSIGLTDYWVIKIDSLGNKQWDNTIGGTDQDGLYSAQQTSDGGYILAGLSMSNISGDKTENSQGQNDFWIVKLDSFGILQWQNTIGGSAADIPVSIKLSPDGGFLVGGYSSSPISGDKTTPNMSTDYWLLKLDSLGNILWQKTIGGNNNDDLFAMDLTQDGGCVLAGTSLSDISGDKTEANIGVGDYWVVKLAFEYNLITGKMYADLNSNSQQDVNELPVPYYRISENAIAKDAYSGTNGNYLMAVGQGNFTVVPSPLSYYTSNPVSHTASFAGVYLSDTLNDFAFQPTGSFNDLCITLSPMTNFRGNQSGEYAISYQNYGTTTISPTVIFNHDGALSYLNATPAANNFTNDSVVWNLGPLLPMQSGTILLWVTVNVGNGILIPADVRIEPVAGDANPVCNYEHFEVIATGSFDPNEILVNEDTLLTTQFPNPPALDYIIRFQNTGTDTAFNVKLLNPINTSMLQLNTFELLAASHPLSLRWVPSLGSMEFKFDNILLPDSNVDEPMSHGFVKYRIHPVGTLNAGDIIRNQAGIYFDFNPPVQTNEATTRVLLPTAMDNHPIASQDVVVYPNPAHDLAVCRNLPLPLTSVKLYDQVGKQINIPASIQYNMLQVDLSSLSSGMYFLELKSKNQSVRKKILKN